MEKEQTEKLKAAFEDIIKKPPFNGTVTHRTRPLFISEWKEYLKENKIHGGGYIDALIKALSKKGSF